jgi:AraC-like DNA-binding protein
MVVLTTDAVPARDRFAYWREVVTRHFLDLRPERRGDGAFHGEIHAHRVGNISVSQVSSGGQRVFRSKPEIARSPVPVYFVNVQADGRSSFRQGGEETELFRGDIFVVDALREFELGVERPFRHLSLKVPKEWLETRLARPDLAAGAVVRQSNQLGRLLSSYLLEGFAAPSQELNARSVALIAGQAVDLLAEAIGEGHADNPACVAARRAALFTQAQRLIRLRFGDPDLAPASIAIKLGISTRLLHKIFAERDSTVMRHVLEERLNHAAAMLATQAASRRSVTDIAFASGFNDSSHFGRVFAVRFGMTPSQWRKRGP